MTTPEVNNDPVWIIMGWLLEEVDDDNDVLRAQAIELTRRLRAAGVLNESPRAGDAPGPPD